MLSYSCMKSKRISLQNYYGEQVQIKGIIAKLSYERGETFVKKTMMLKNVVITTSDGDVTFDHMWFPATKNAKVNKPFRAIGEVSCYQRRSGSYEYCVKLLDSKANNKQI